MLRGKNRQSHREREKRAERVMPTRPRGGGVPVGEGQVETVAHDGSGGGAKQQR